MPRTARIVVPDYPFHITQRGNNRQDIFSDDEDREKYLSYLDEYSKEYKLSILAYCLMTNHVHFIAVPEQEDSLSKTFSSTHHRYSQYYNKKKKSSGHLWQGRFYSCLLDQIHLMMALRYVERNPVRAKMVKQPWGYKWSSAAYHTGRTESDIRLSSIDKYIDISNQEWEEYLLEKEDKEELVTIREHTMKGSPIGNGSFIVKLEEKIGKILRSKPRGRPRKKKDGEK